MLTRAERNTLSQIQAKIDKAKLRGEILDLSAEEEKFLDLVAVKKSRLAIRNKALAGKPLSAREDAFGPRSHKVSSSIPSS